MYYLALQNTYHEVQLALLQDGTPLQTTTIPKIHASKELIARINELLEKQSVALSDLACIVTNCGPGPFTTLRVVVTTVDGIAYASGVPLVGINALHAAAREWSNPTFPTTAILFNAFGDDVYTLVEHEGAEYLYGSYPITTVIEKLAQLHVPVRLCGNGATLHRDAITAALGTQALFEEQPREYCSLETIGILGREAFEKGATSSFLLPVYLKQHPAAR